MFKTCQFEHVKVKGSKSSGMTIVLPSFWGSVKQYMHIYIYNYIYNATKSWACSIQILKL